MRPSGPLTPGLIGSEPPKSLRALLSPELQGGAEAGTVQVPRAPKPRRDANVVGGAVVELGGGRCSPQPPLRGGVKVWSGM